MTAHIIATAGFGAVLVTSVTATTITLKGN